MSQGTWIGQTLSGRYRIEERLGQGGMSAVYKAYDPNLRRVVAIKMIHAHLSENPDFIRRFEEEAAAVAQLRHPNIIQVYDFNHDGGSYYMVLEFVPGETLQERLRRLNEHGRRMPPVEVANAISQVAEAVQYAHERGMIHRDIKPANIMLDVHGKAILMDFGIAKILGGQLHTATGAVVGTAMYMSPEQITGERVDERSDIYSLGVTLFEALSGKPPFAADSAMTLMMMHINDPVPNIRELRPEVAEEMVLAAEKALQKKKELRYQSASQMAGALNKARARLEPASTSAVVGVKAAVVEVLPTDATIAETPIMHAVEGSIAPPPAYAQAAPVASAVPPRRSAQATSRKRPRTIKLPLLIGGGIGLLSLGAVALVALILLGRNFLIGDATAATRTPTVDAVVDLTSTTDAVALAAVAREATATNIPTAPPTATSIPTATPVLPTNTPEPFFSPTPAVPADRPYVLIKNITIDNNRYVVDYETYEYTETLPGMHVHFFFDTVAPENAGVPGSGPWILYGGPRPFTKYTVAERPQYAAQMCALVANSNHSIQPDSGNCLDLPSQ